MKEINPKIKGTRRKMKTHWQIEKEKEDVRIGEGIRENTVRKKKANRVAKKMRKVNRKTK